MEVLRDCGQIHCGVGRALSRVQGPIPSTLYV
ncbi:unnamed protein product [Phytomonas sp. Hart1]|nr:unnamed protein product [Phytomonas sp. Hart1]|eukprot:CCW72241.1 unnamed protein product [Phytomonas sp. isolate Hart1]